MSRRYIGMTVTFKYVLNELQMQQVKEASERMKLIATCDPIEIVNIEEPPTPLTERELSLEEMRIK